MVSIISALAATVPVAAGVALALRYGQDGVAFSYFGDGATSRGDWHEGVNFAAVQKLPVVFICNNNQYAYSTPLGAADGVRQRGRPRPRLQHAGRDRGRQRRAGGPRRQRARPGARPRPGKGPYLLECKTFRMTGHSAHDAAHYVPKDLFDEWGKLRSDPAPGSERAQEALGRPPRRLTRCSARVVAEVDEAVAWAERSPVSRSRHAARRRVRNGIAWPPWPTTYLEAIREGIWEEMERDPNVFLLGEDIGVYGGAFKVTAGFFEQFGETRVVDTPISEAAIVGAAIGAATDGTAAGGGDAVRRFHHLRLRPDCELRRQVPLPLGRGGAHGDARALGRRHPRRAVPLAESRNVVRAHARA